MSGPYRSSDVVRQTYELGPNEIKEAIELWLESEREIEPECNAKYLHTIVRKNGEDQLHITVTWDEPY